MNHPSDEQLRHLLLESTIASSISSDEQQKLEQHVNSCPTCLERLETQVRGSADDRQLLARLLLEGPCLDLPGARAKVEEPPPDQPASLGEYDILQCLGAGGMGVVYKAHHRQLNRLVAVKLLLPGRADQQQRLARFHAEARALAQLRHRNIITLYDAGEHEGRPWLALEWADGGALADQMRTRPLPERQAAEQVQVLAAAIHHAHQHNIIHRDLKPANVLLSSDGSGAEPILKITDFGIAKLLHEQAGMTCDGQALGTPEYMAPEQARGDKGIGAAADVYALGAILYEMLTGRPPFRAETLLETLRQVREEEPVPPRVLRPRLAKDLETICLKCLHKEPHKRYTSARTLAEDLGRFLKGEPILARPTTTVERAWRWCKRHPTGAAFAALAAVFVLALLFGLVWQFRAANLREAEHLAEIVERQLPHLQRAVRTTAQKEELRALVAQRNSAGLKDHLLATIEQLRRDFTLPGETQPFMNLFVLDANGKHLADSLNHPRALASDLPLRDYLRHFLDQSRTCPLDAVYFSEVYRSVHDGRYKFAVITRVLGDTGCVGFLAASIPIDSRLVAVNMRHERPGAVIVGPMDWTYASDVPEEKPGWVVVLHGGYDTPGGPPRWPSEEHLAHLDAFTSSPALERVGQHITSTGGCADYVRVGGTHFVAIVEKDYPAPLCYVLDRRLARWWLLVGGACAALVFLRLLVRR